MNNAAFKRDFAKLLKAAGDKADLVVRNTALQLQSSLVEMSPVDTGRFKGNWQCGVGSTNSSTASPPSTDGTVVLGRTQRALDGWKPGQTIYLTNSLPYARPLEYGWSKQAPSGMVRLTVQNYVKALAQSVEALS